MDKKGRSKVELFIILGISIILAIGIVGILANADLQKSGSAWDRGKVYSEILPYGEEEFIELIKVKDEHTGWFYHYSLASAGLELGFNQTGDISILDNTFWMLGFDYEGPYDPNVIAQVNNSLINNKLGITNDYQFAFGDSSYYVDATHRFPVDMLNKPTYIHFSTDGASCFKIYATADDTVKTKGDLAVNAGKILIADESGCLDPNWCRNWQHIQSNLTFQTKSFNNSNPSNDLSAVGLFGPSTEICDGEDNDCDGAVDEYLPAITTDVYGYDNIGECRVQIEECVSGSYQITQTAVGPSQELCDSLDNDCDGIVDEGCPRVEKQKVLTALQAIYPKTAEINDAIKKIQESLNPAYWIDANHVICKYSPGGDRYVFEKERDAAYKLQKKPNTIAYAKALADVDRNLANTLYLEAKAANPTHPEVKKALQYLTEGDRYYNQAKYKEAIEKYKNAWYHAEKVAPICTGGTTQAGMTGMAISDISGTGASWLGTISIVSIVALVIVSLAAFKKLSRK